VVAPPRTIRDHSTGILGPAKGLCFLFLSFSWLAICAKKSSRPHTVYSVTR
jgi:hypothetical protein